MKYFVLILSLFSVFAGHLSAATFSLDQLIDSTYAFSGEVKNSTIVMEQSYNKNKEVRSRLFPRVVLHGNYTRTMRSFDPYADESTFSFSDELVDGFTGGADWGDRYLAYLLDERFESVSHATKRNKFEFGISVIQPVLHGGTGLVDYKISKVESSLLVCHWQEVRMKVKTTIAKLYYEAQLQQKRTNLLEEITRLAAKNHKMATATYLAGAALPYDTLKTFMESVKAEEALFESKQRTHFALFSLQKASGVTFDSSFAVEESLEVLAYSQSYDTALVRLSQMNKQITTLRGEYERSQLMVEKAKQQFRPEIVVGADFIRASHFINPDWAVFEPERRVYVDLSYDIVAAGMRWFSLAQAKQEEQIIQNRLDDLLRERQLELKRSWDEWALVKARLERVRTAVEIGKVGYQTALDQYKKDVLSLNELNEVLKKYLEIQMSYYDLVYRNNLAVIEIRLLTADYLYN